MLARVQVRPVKETTLFYFRLCLRKIILFPLSPSVFPAFVPVKMSVGTETEKFWDSLWELQAECTGLLWVERHPWARGDLDQSAHESDTSGG